jgi:hypothetical protein
MMPSEPDAPPAIETRVDAPLGPALRLAAALGGADARAAALARAERAGRDRDVHAATRRVATARAAQVHGNLNGAAVASARLALVAARRDSLRADPVVIG